MPALKSVKTLLERAISIKKKKLGSIFFLTVPKTNTEVV